MIDQKEKNEMVEYTKKRSEIFETDYLILGFFASKRHLLLNPIFDSSPEITLRFFRTLSMSLN